MAKPLSNSGQKLKAKLASGEETQVGLAEFLRCDQTTISKWFTNGATPTLAMAVKIEERWPDITARGWLVIDLGRDRPRERGKRGKSDPSGDGGRGGVP